ncbi:MAG: efflux RND transporter periplasmic adaptor subunit [Rhodothermia bacterium]
MSRSLKLMAVGAIAIAVAGCGSGAPPPPPPPEVTVAKPQLRDVTQYAEFTGTTQANKSTNIRARVSGNLDTMLYTPSTFIKKGELLFQIEKTEYEAARGEARASKEAAEADLRRKKSDLERIEQAIESNAVSEQDLDQAKANFNMAEAALLGAEARLARADLDYSYTDVRSPISGLVGRNRVDPGNLVGASEPTLLTTVRNVDPMFVYFDVPEIAIIRLLEVIREEDKKIGSVSARGGTVDEQMEDQQAFPGWIALSTDSGFPHKGFIDFIDNTVDPGTGTIEIRLVVPNKEQLLFPGLFVRVRLAGKQIPDAVAIDEKAVGSDIGGKYVYVVGNDNIVEQRYVTLGPPSEDGLISVVNGLEADEDYIINGILRARPGLPVTPLREGAAPTGDG